MNDATARVRAVHETLKAARAPRPRVTVITDIEAATPAMSDTPTTPTTPATPATPATPWIAEIVARAGATAVRVDQRPEIVVFAPPACDLPHASDAARRAVDDATWHGFPGADVWAIDARRLVPADGAPYAEAIETLARICNPPLFPPLDAALAACLRRGRDVTRS